MSALHTLVARRRTLRPWQVIAAAAVLMALAFAMWSLSARAAANVTPAAGGNAISVDTAANATSPSYTTLTDLAVAEDVAGDITADALTLHLPAGFQFNTAQNVTVTPSGDGCDINLGAGAGAAYSGLPNAGNFQVLITAASTGAPCTLTFTDVQVQPIDGVLRAPAHMNFSGAVVGESAGELGTVAGAPAQIELTGPESVDAGVESDDFIIEVQDQFDNATDVGDAATFGLTTTSGGAFTFSPSAAPVLQPGFSSMVFTYTDAQAGVQTVTATFQNGDDAGLTGESDTHEITVNPGGYSAANSTVAVSGDGSVEYGGTLTVSLTARDALGNPITTLDPAMVMFSTSGGTSQGSFDDKTHVGSGVYQATFTPLVVGTESDLDATYTHEGADAELGDDPTITVTAKALTITSGVSVADKPYDGDDPATLEFDDPVLDGIEDGDNVSIDEESEYTATFAAAGVGEDIVVTVAGGLELAGDDADNYTLNQPDLKGNITAKPLTIEGIDATNIQDKPYDGDAVATIIGDPVLTLEGVVDGDTVTLINPAAAFPDENVGNDLTVTVTGELAGADADNYTLTNLEIEEAASITAKALQITGIDIGHISDKPYDGNAGADVDDEDAGLDGVEGGDTVSLDTVTGVFPGKNVGDDLTVTVTGTLTGDDAANYTVDPLEIEGAAIYALEITVTPDGGGKVYGETDPAFTYSVTVGALQDGDEFTGALGRDAGENVDDYNITQGTLAIDDGNGGANYDLEVESDIFQISPRLVTVNAAPDTKVFDGTTTSDGVPSVDIATPLVDGDTGNFTQAFTSAEAGTENRTLVPSGTVTDGGDADVTANYEITFENFNEGTISAKTITVEGVDGPSRDYDGTMDADLNTSTPVFQGLEVGFTDVTLTDADTSVFADKHAGADKPVTVSGLSLTGVDADNYTLEQPTDVTGTITAVAITVTAETDLRSYDGTTDSDGEPQVTSGELFGGDSIDAITQAFDTKHAGENKTITPAGVVTDGNGGNNYTLTLAPISTGEITTRAITVTADAGKTKVYGQADPALTAQVTGGTPLAQDDTLSGILSRNPGEDVGTYTILAGTLSVADDNGGNNYDITWVSDDLEITVLAVTVTVDAGQTKVYGDADPEFTFTSSVDPLPFDDEFIGALARVEGEGVGPYQIGTGDLAVNDGNNGDNYNLTVTPGTTFEITKKSLSITGVTGATKVFDGDTDADGAVTGTAVLDPGGIVAGDEGDLILSAPTYTFAQATVGDPIEVTVTGVLDGSAAVNYELQDQVVQGSITPKPVTITGIEVNHRPFSAGVTSAAVFEWNGTPVGLVGGYLVVSASQPSANFVDGGGVPTDQVGTWSVVVDEVILAGGDAGNYTVEVPFTLDDQYEISDTPVIGGNADTLPDWTADHPGYSVDLEVDGGVGPYTWSVFAGALPDDLVLNPASGEVTGTPSVADDFTFTIRVTDSLGGTGDQAYEITINPALAITTAAGALDEWTVDRPNYPDAIERSGGTPPFNFADTLGDLPDGLTLNADGTFAGSPTVDGTSNFTVEVTDQAGATAAVAFSIEVNPAVSIITPTLPGGSVDVAYDEEVTTDGGGTAPLTFTVTAGTLPAGLTLNADGSITGTPLQEAAGAFDFTITVTDAAGSSDSQQYTGTITAALDITTTTLPGWTQGLAGYDGVVQATGGTEPYTFALAGGSDPLPTDLTLNADGTFSGTPSVADTFEFTVEVTDSATPQDTDTQVLTIIINAAPTVTTAPGTLQAGTVGHAYAGADIDGDGGTPALSYSAANLPAGLTMDEADGTISGTPTAAGTFNFNVTVTDTLGASGNAGLFTIEISAAPTITTTTLESSTLGDEYGDLNVALEGTSDAGALTWSVTVDSLPDGLSLNAGTGAITGISTQAGTFTFTVQAADVNGATTTREMSITIVGAADGPSSTVGASNTSPTAGATVTITVTLRDAHGAQRLGGGEITAIFFDDDQVDLGDITDNNDGTYTAELTRASAGAVVVTALFGPDVNVGDGSGVTVTFTAVQAPAPSPSPSLPALPPLSPVHPVVTRVNEAESEPVQEGGAAEVSTTADNGATVKADAPANALPDGGKLKAAVVGNMDQLTQQARPPRNADVVLAFVLEAEDEDGNAVTEFDEPIALEFNFPATSVPAGATDGTLVLVFWNGTKWVEVEGTVTVNPDGSYTIQASVDHFTIFGVQHQPDRGQFTPVPASAGVSLTTWGGGGYGLIAAALPDGGSVWIATDGKFTGYTVGAPDFVNAAFQALFPGTVDAGTNLIVVPASNEADTDASEAPAEASDPAVTTWTVEAGDSLISIGAATGVPWEAIAAANGIDGPDYGLQIGQVLTIPSV